MIMRIAEPVCLEKQSPDGLATVASDCRNLVVVRAGRNSLHERWIEGGGERDFDVLVATYEEGARGQADARTSIIFVPGPKIAGYAQILRRYPALLDRYDFIALFDDDIAATRRDIERLFEIGRRHRLDLFQPALSWDSYFSYAATLVNGAYRLRFANAIEMMCPVFSAAQLKRAMPLLELGYETGIDLLWTRLGDDPWFRYAIVDDVVVKHTRPVGTTSEQQGFLPGDRYDGQVRTVLDRFGATFRGFVCYAAIDRRDQAVVSRWVIALRSIRTWAAWKQTPLRVREFARLATDFTRHCLLRPLNLTRVDVSAPRPGWRASAAAKAGEIAR